MKKFIFGLILAFMMSFSVNAQVATEKAKLFDNTYVTVQGGAATSLMFDEVFPVNGIATLAIGKQLTPTFALEVEGDAWFGSHMYGNTRFDGLSHNIVRTTYVGLNGKTNWTNLLCGYKGAPRTFEVGTTAGLGWIHMFTPGTEPEGRIGDGLGAKTALDLSWNLGKAKAHTLTVQPAVLWNLSVPGNSKENLAFNRKGAQLYLGVGYTYHFKTSNGTHHFKQYDIAAYRNKIAYLENELAKKPKEVIVEKIVIKEVPVETKTSAQQPAYVFFAQNSAELTDEAKAELDKITGTVTVTATASPEGAASYNQALSQRRADAVKAYLESRGVTVQEATGLGVTGKTSNRVSKIETK